MEPGRGRYRPPVGLPDDEESRGRWRGLIVSIALHALVLLLLLTSAVASGLIRVDPRHLMSIPSILSRGVGGRGMRERVGWVALPAPTPAAESVPSKSAREKSVEATRLPTPAQKPPVAPLPQSDTAPRPPSNQGDQAQLPGGGPGRGTGSGLTGTGAGSGAGVGKGGEQGETAAAGKVRATYVDLPAVGLDPPKKVLPFHLVAMFEIDARGDPRILSVTPTRDGDFNKRIRSELLEIRWRPAVLANGTPVTDTVQVSLDLE